MRALPAGVTFDAGERLAKFQAQMEPLASRRPATYPAGNDDAFVCTACVEGGFNRAVVFQGAVLHSGDILRPHLSADPMEGRLTATTFLTVE